MKKNRKDWYPDQGWGRQSFLPCSLEKMVPTNLKIPHNRYDGMTDPYNYISYFQTSLDLYDATDTAKCRMFPAILRGIGRTWFDLLLDQSIHSLK